MPAERLCKTFPKSSHRGEAHAIANQPYRGSRRFATLSNLWHEKKHSVAKGSRPLPRTKRDVQFVALFRLFSCLVGTSARASANGISLRAGVSPSDFQFGRGSARREVAYPEGTRAENGSGWRSSRSRVQFWRILTIFKKHRSKNCMV